MRFTIMNKFFGEAEIYDVDDVSVLAYTHQEVIRLNISVKDVFFVHELDTIQDLFAQLQDGSKR